jgi:16S rRNA (cytosine967-C5)-methyltransferase
MSVSPARRIAFDVLLRVEAEGAFAADLLHSQLEQARGLKPEDAALATELTLGVLRWQRLLDAHLEQRMDKPAAKLDLEVRLALRLGLHQLRSLERVPPHAIVNESVELVKRARKTSAAGLVNAVLRKAAASGLQTVPASAERGIIFSHPTWLVSRWEKRFGNEPPAQLMEANNQPPRMTCAVHDESMRQRAAEALARAGIVAEPAAYLRSAWIVRGGNPAATRAFRRGWISVQDEASQMVPLLLDVQPGQRVLDLCAAPGGKTTALASAAGANSLVVAADLHLHRLHALRQNLARVGAAYVPLVQLDAQQPLCFSGQFDRILVDAPCSGTGTLARNPEIRWRLQAEDLPQLAERQVAILRSALDALAPGGRLVYATCSLEPEENEEVVEHVLAEVGGLRLLPGRDALLPHLHPRTDTYTLFDDRGFFRTFPHVHGTDGFFAAVFQRIP